MNESLHWQPDRVRKILTEHGIHTRGRLAATLESAGVGRKTVYNTFDRMWNGRVSQTVHHALAQTFNVPLSYFVAENRRKLKLTT